jgi:hypothetical protein
VGFLVVLIFKNNNALKAVIEYSSVDGRHRIVYQTNIAGRYEERYTCYIEQSIQCTLKLNKLRGYTESHKANFPNINHSNDDADPKGGKGLNNTEHKRQRT